ncbi:MAG: S9 family peptidase [Hyphomonadaceae bacterium]|nr:S9 family peptidase [Hyphomonadaceae bacterium]
MRRTAGAICALALLLAAAACQERARTDAPPPEVARLIPRADLFGDPARANGRINPQGDLIAFLAPANGVTNVWVTPTRALNQARPVTLQTGLGVSSFTWAETGRHILFTEPEAQGGEHLFAVDVATGDVRDLTPVPGVRARIVAVNEAEPSIVIAALVERDRPELFRIDVVSGERTQLERNEQRFSSYYVDLANAPRLALKPTDDGGAEMWSRAPNGRWSLLFPIPFEGVASSRFISFEQGGRTFLMLDSTDRDRAALVRVDAASGDKTVLGESQRADVVDVWLDPATRAPQAYAAEYLRREWRGLAPAAQADLAYLDAQLEGEPRVLSRTRDDKRWIVEEEGPVTPARTWLYDRSNPQAPKMTMLFRNRPALEGRRLAQMTPVEIEARDGLTLVSYLTLPPGADQDRDGRPDAPLPLALVVHDGPWTRDAYTFSAEHQWLADRGYAALSVNFRGSTGFGKAFLNAGNREWGGRMQDDLIDAVRWAVSQRIAQAERVAIFGRSLGGFGAIAGLASAPDVFACGVSVSGFANLQTAVQAMPIDPASRRAELYKRIGDPRDAQDQAMMRERSPIFRAGAIRAPLLIAQGGRDARAPRAELDAVVASLRARRVPVIYLVYPSEDAVFAKAANRVAFFAAAEAFLGQCLGGFAQPFGRDFVGAGVRTMAGGDRIVGLTQVAPPPAAPRQPAAAEQKAAPAPAQLLEEFLNNPDLPIPTAPPPAAEERPEQDPGAQ